MIAFSQKPWTSCSGEYESNATFFCCASVTARSKEPTRWTVSASVNNSQLPRALAAPATRAWFLPLQPGGKGPGSTNRTSAKDCAISRVLSDDPSSTIMISKSTPVWPTSDSRQVPRQASSLRAGTITDTMGRSDTGYCAIARIRYYSFVRRASVLLAILTVLIVGCYRGSRPPRIGTAAPEFTVQDADR